MALELDVHNFHRSVLTDFRERLAQGDRSDQLELITKAVRVAWQAARAGAPPTTTDCRLPLLIVSPYDPTARYARRGQVTRRAGFVAHLTEPCSAPARA
ncbi:hypothetical protein [Streptomyces kaempferi]|uniref:Uncharacterized protein n=1 Tax=Streptomyces kaempferi TaxID=333725 RepID=A0ABW3XPN7_9ACTN